MVNLVSPRLFSFVSTSTFATYIFTDPTCKATIFSLEPCALNVEFQHFNAKFNKISLLYGYPQRRVWGERRPKDRVTLRISIYTCTYMPQNIYTWPCKCIWQIFILALCKCKWFTLTLDLHVVYTVIDAYTHNNGPHQITCI